LRVLSLIELLNARCL